jgi:hypothetical protein
MEIFEEFLFTILIGCTVFLIYNTFTIAKIKHKDTIRNIEHEEEMKKLYAKRKGHGKVF